MPGAKLKTSEARHQDTGTLDAALGRHREGEQRPFDPARKVAAARLSWTRPVTDRRPARRRFAA
jgi:hypothetical protein